MTHDEDRLISTWCRLQTEHTLASTDDQRHRLSESAAECERMIHRLRELKRMSPILELQAQTVRELRRARTIIGGVTQAVNNLRTERIEIEAELHALGASLATVRVRRNDDKPFVGLPDTTKRQDQIRDLCNCAGRTVKELISCFPQVSGATIYREVGILERAGLVRKEGGRLFAKNEIEIE